MPPEMWVPTGPETSFFRSFFWTVFYRSRTGFGMVLGGQNPSENRFLGSSFSHTIFDRLFSYFLSILGVFFQCFWSVSLYVFCYIIVNFLLCVFFENIDFVCIFTVSRGCWLSLAKICARRLSTNFLLNFRWILVLIFQQFFNRFWTLF